MIQEARHFTQLIDLLPRMTPGQRLRARKLLDEYAALKREVLNPTPVELVEPCLASPRSSLSPEHFAQFALGNEVRDGKLAADAKRESYQAAEEKQ